MRFSRVIFPSLLALQMCPGVLAQDVVSARSGMVHFLEGQVFLDDHQLDRKAGSFQSIKEGSTLRTEKGRAEVLLTPGAFLRLDENSAIRMVSTELADTRLVFVEGSVILDLSEARANNTIAITYRDARARFPKRGVYRLDGDTGVLQVYSGEASVEYAGKQTQVDPSHLYFCWLGLATNKLGDGTEDEFYDWASDRNQVIGEENQLAEQTGHDPGEADADLNAQLGAPGALPPTMLPPSAGTQSYPLPNRTYSYGTYALGSTLFNPFLTFAPTTVVPLAYPLLVVRQPHTRTAGSYWPHKANSPLWHRVTNGASSLPPRLPSRTVLPGLAGGFRTGATPHMSPGGITRPNVSAPARPMISGHFMAGRH